jgi:hypothetical protein
MDTPGVGVLVDPDRIEQIDPYFVEIRGTRYYGTTPEDAVREARKKLSNGKSSNSSSSSKGDTKKPVTNIISVATPTPLVANQMQIDRTLLGLSANATAADIKSAFKKAVLATHSNKGGTGDVGELTAARDRLLTAAAKTVSGGGKRRKPLKRTRVGRKRRSTTRKHLK